jgi:CHAT domain-containing protein
LFSLRGIGDVEAVRSLSSLPETAGELEALAHNLKASPDSLLLREEATEPNLRSVDLERYRVLAFATHAVVAGELRGLAEPALVLTPPDVGTEENDGLLTASEVAGLKLDADWVILSACNTAAPDGTPGAEALSGLAKAFFYAGSRALLVSHWPVSSEAAVALTTRMLAEYANDPGIGRAEALRRSMMALMMKHEDPRFAHPFYWAPFVIVGEGGVPADRAIGVQ